MPRLEEITVGSQVKGIAAGEPVTVIAVQWYGNAAAEITFKNSKGQLASQIVYREDESQLEILGDHLPWSFDGDADRMRLVSEAYRINLAHIFDPYLAVHTSSMLFIKRCCHACLCVILWLMILVLVKLL